MHAIFNRLRLFKRTVSFSIALLLFPFVQSIQKSYSTSAQFSHSGKLSTSFIKKNDYINRLTSNSKEFYFLIIYTPETQNEAFMLSTKLSSLFPDLPSFLIPFSDYQDALKTINRIKNDQIYSIPSSVKDLVLYFFTPYSQNPVQLKHKSLQDHHLRRRREEGVNGGRGFRGEGGAEGGEGLEEEMGEERGGVLGRKKEEEEEGRRIFSKKVKRVIKKVRRMEKLVEVIDEKGLERVLKEAWRKRVGEGVIVRVVEGAGRREDEGGLKMEDGGGDEFRRVIFNALNLRLLPMETKVLILNNEEAKKKYKLLEGEIYFFRNDILQRFEDQNTTTMIPPPPPPPPPPGIEIDGFRLERYEGKNLSGFAEFILPRVFILNDVNSKSVSTFFKKVTYNRDKPIFSYVEAESEITLNRKPKKLFQKQAIEEVIEGEREKELLSLRQIFFNLYYKYGDKMLFVILNNEKLEELFPHGNPLFPKFCIFNFFNQERFEDRKEGGTTKEEEEDGKKKGRIGRGRKGLGDWHGKLLYPYEKYFLEEGGRTEKEDLERRVEAVLRKEARKDYLSTNYDLVQEINGEFLNDNNLWKGKEEERGKEGLGKREVKRVIQIYGENGGDLAQRKIFNELAEQRSDLKFYRMNYLNGCKWVPNVGGGGKNGYVVIDQEKKEVKIMEIGRDEEIKEKLTKFLE